MDNSIIARAAGLIGAVVTEYARVVADQDRTRVSISTIQRDAQNFSHYVHTGTWLVHVNHMVQPQSPTTNPEARSDRFA